MPYVTTATMPPVPAPAQHIMSNPAITKIVIKPAEGSKDNKTDKAKEVSKKLHREPVEH